MATSEEKRDKHFPLFVHDNLLRRLFSEPKKYCPCVSRGQMVADLGCGPGYYTLALAERVGPQGRVYAVDSNEKAIRALEKKADQRSHCNIEAHASSASDLGFIEDELIDFVLADGLLCSMAPQERQSAVSEISRILKPTGKAYLKVARGPWSYVDQARWETMLGSFRVERREDGSPGGDRWAVVSKKSRKL